MEGWMWLVLVLIPVIGAILLYNQIVNAYNLVKRGWADVLTQERQRGNIIPQLESVLSQHKEYEGELLANVTRLRAGIDALDSNVIDTQKQHEVNLASKDLLKGIQIAVEAYPELGASESFAKVMKEVTDQEENVGAALRIFNQNVEIFNSLIQNFPANIVNSLTLKKQAIDVFADDVAASAFSYKPNFD